MKTISRTATATVVLALTAAPAFGHGKPSADEHGKLAAPGQYCKAASKQHVKGQKGTPFSACVKAQAKLRSGRTDSPRTACKSASKKHVKGQKGTPFSVCVRAGKQLLEDKQALENDDS